MFTRSIGRSADWVRERPERRSIPDPVLGALLVLPAVLLVFGMILYPFLYEAWLSLTNARAAEPGVVVGLTNYVDLVQSDLFWQAVGNTTVYVVVGTALKLGLGLAMALTL